MNNITPDGDTPDANSIPRPLGWNLHADDLSPSASAEKEKSSRIPGFYELPMAQRFAIVKHFANLTEQDRLAAMQFSALSSELTDIFIENAIGTFSLPLGVALNFRINDQDYLIPMVVEESSVLAASSHAAKLVRAGGGFRTSSTPPIMTGQIQIFPQFLHNNFNEILEAKKSEIIAFANRGQSRLLERGGGAKDLSWRWIPEIKSLVLHLDVDTRDAMGANIVNTMCERVSALVAEYIPCDIGLRILTNLSDKRLAKAECTIPWQAFDSDEYDGKLVTDRIEKAYLFAYYDKYRATTNNKGIMNGIDPILIATGNDWRAVEAGAHSYCVDASGQYRPMAKWQKLENGDLYGSLELPMAVGIVGGVTKLHPTAQTALKILGHPNANELAEIICCAGLAQNLAALRALASEGIQRGHMSLHQKNLFLLASADKLKQ
jgi:hydroxymethylglutaryl-CoA reductase